MRPPEVYMAVTEITEANDITHALPRRRALQGIAGSLAGMTALGAVPASAQNKGKKGKKGKKFKKNQASQKGQLLRITSAGKTATIPTAAPITVTVTCPKAKKGERVFAVGGGYESNQGALTMFTITSRATNNRRGWKVGFINAAAPQDAVVSAVCAYFTKK